MGGRRRQASASFRTFLKTGELGPLKPTMALMDVARLLGPPRTWVTQEAGESVPVYWTHEHLEISFEETAPHRIIFFQLENVADLIGPGRFLGDAMRLNLAGLNGRMLPSDLLSRRLLALSDVTVRLTAGAGAQMSVSAGSIDLIYRVDRAYDPRDPYDERPDPAEAAAAAAAGDLRTLVSLFDQRARCDSIYAHPSRRPFAVLPADRSVRMTGKQYLDFLKAPKLSHRP